MSHFCLIFLLFCNITYNSCTSNTVTFLHRIQRAVPPQIAQKQEPKVPSVFLEGPQDSGGDNGNPGKQEKVPAVQIKPVHEDQSQEPIPQKPNEPVKNATISTTPSDKEDLKKPLTDVESGALIRGVLVFVILSFIFLIYLSLKTYFRKRAIPLVTKYGVRARRSDIEMTPLHEDDDDETIFEIGHQNR